MEIKKLTEIAILRYISENIFKNISKGRIRSKSKQLIKLIDKEMNKDFNLLDFNKLTVIDKKIKQWADLTGWDGKKKHIITFISFLAILLENSKYEYNKLIYDKFNEIVDFYERQNKSKIICMVGGKIAYEKWVHVMNDKNIWKKEKK